MIGCGLMQEMDRAPAGLAQTREYGSRSSALAFDLMLPLALPAFLVHRETGRWILWRPLRRVYAVLLGALLRRLVARDARGLPGAMAFYEPRR